jgi:4-carboxymuconolactone decarboxylase
MARVRLVGLEGATGEQQAAFAEVGAQRGGVANLFRALGHSPEATRRIGAVGAFLRFDADLSARLREVVTLAVAGRWGCAYEELHHRPLAVRLGLDPATIDALLTGAPPDERLAALEPLEVSAVRYALALAHSGQAPSALADELRAGLGERGLVELTALVGYYSRLALILNGLEVDLDAQPPLPPEAS